MGEMVGSKHAVSESVPHESPLVPNRKMKQMYEGIVESRLLEDMLRKRHKKIKRPSTRGQEACRVSALIDLDPSDLISDAATGIPSAFLRGLPLQTIVAHADAAASGKKKDAAAAKLDLAALLPAVEDTADRIKLTLGTALAIKRLKLPRVVVFFAAAADLKLSAWQKSLRFAAREELPILFVALPEPTVASGSAPHKPFELSARATASGVPGIPVDASDAVALYRVAQESLGRARSNGGPALMECISFPLEGSKKKTLGDPVTAMSQTLLNRKVCDETWLTNVSTSFEALLNAL